jgi:NifU-like protein involved in Fe-S cluster formation
MPHKIHCSVLAESAIEEALKDYKLRKNIWIK